MEPCTTAEIIRPLASRLVPEPRRIVIKAVNWLGDLVMTLPAMRAVRGAFPDAHLAILIKKELASFFDGENRVDEVIPYTVASGITGFNDRFSTRRSPALVRTGFQVDVEGCAASLSAGLLNGENLGMLESVVGVASFADHAAA